MEFRLLGFSKEVKDILQKCYDSFIELSKSSIDEAEQK